MSTRTPHLMLVAVLVGLVCFGTTFVVTFAVTFDATSHAVRQPPTRLTFDDYIWKHIYFDCLGKYPHAPAQWAACVNRRIADEHKWVLV